MRSGEEFEALTETIFRAITSDPSAGDVRIERDVQMEGPEGPRQIDILMSTSAGPIELTTIIECKDHRRLVDITKVEALHEVQQDVKASKAVMVTRRGYSKGARQKAKRLGISLFTAGRLSDLADEAFKVPIYIHEFAAHSVDIHAAFMVDAAPATFERRALLRVNDMDLFDVLRDDLLGSFDGGVELTAGQEWTPTDSLPPPWWIRDVNGQQHEVKELRAQYTLKERHLFAYLNDLESALTLKNEIDETAQRNVVFKGEDLMDLIGHPSVIAFDSAAELPVPTQLMAIALRVSDYDRHTARMSLDGRLVPGAPPPQ